MKDAFAQHHAVVIGVNDFLDEMFPDLRWAVHDAEEVGIL